MKHKILLIAILSIAFSHISCKKLVDIDAPKDKIAQETLFENDDLATTAITGIYSRMASLQGAGSIHHLCGMSADELKNYDLRSPEFYENQLTPINSSNNSLYLNYYSFIYSTNAVLEGLATSKNLTPTVNTQLKGEALFTRAFCYFYLVNLYGPVPLQLVTDYRITRKTTRTAVAEVYQQIISDLKTAEGLLTDKYVTSERVRPNLPAVQALLARTYLYLQDWSNAEKYSTLVIGKSNLYSLPVLDNVFLKNSSEAIWQLFPPVNANTAEGLFFNLINTPASISLSSDFQANKVFEQNDRRSVSWVKSLTNTTGTYYYPSKYKIRSSTTITEYSMILRLAEQFLIRAEARAQQNNLSGSVDDLDKIRERAGLVPVRISNPSINEADLLADIQKERRVELFTEWGHRWFDLKRTGQATTVLQSLKSKWQITDILYPIPYDETSRNPNIKQNEGY